MSIMDAAERAACAVLADEAASCDKHNSDADGGDNGAGNNVHENGQHNGDVADEVEMADEAALPPGEEEAADGADAVRIQTSPILNTDK